VISASPRLFTPTPAAELFKPGPHAGAEGEEAGDGENCAGVPAVGAGGNRYNVERNAAAFSGRRRVGIGTYTTLAPLDEPKRWQLGPTILFDRPRPAPPTPPPSDFPVGWPAALWRRGQARRAMRAMVRRNFSNRAHTQVRRVRKRGTERTALAFQRSAQGGNRYIYNARSAG
jgi:hypothetical protein